MKVRSDLADGHEVTNLVTVRSVQGTKWQRYEVSTLRHFVPCKRYKVSRVLSGKGTKCPDT